MGPNHDVVRSVLIVGGGFAGLACALELAENPNVSVTLIDKHNYQQFQPLLYQVATGSLSPSNAAFSFRDMLRDLPNVDVQMADVTSVDLAAHAVVSSEGNRWTADYLVLAMGSQVNFYNTPGAAKYALPLYSLVDAETVRSLVLRAFEDADRGMFAASSEMNLVVIGGGPTGVEIAGALADTVSRVVQKEFRHIDSKRVTVTLIESNPVVLRAFSKGSQNYAASALRRRGVALFLGAGVQELTSDAVYLTDGRKIAAKMVIWAAGLRASSVPLYPEPQREPSGRLRVEPDLKLPRHQTVYAIGDIANAESKERHPLPQLAAVAKQAGKHCGKNILAQLKGAETAPFVYRDRGILAMVGRDAAVAELGESHHEFAGVPAFTSWLGIHAALLPVVRAKVEAIIEWAWECFKGEHPSQFIDN